MHNPSPAPPRRGCGCGCLLTTPLALVLTGLALWLWLPQALRFAVFVVGGQEANPWPLAGATALIVGAQVLPRVLPTLVALVRRGAARIVRTVCQRMGWPLEGDPNDVPSPTPAAAAANAAGGETDQRR